MQGVSIGEVAEALGISVSYVRKLTDQGVFPSSRTPGGHRRYDLDRVREAWPPRRGAARPSEGGPQREGTGTSMHRPDPDPAEVAVTVSLEDAREEAEWARLSHHFDGASGDAIRILRYAFTEMLNNAIDHSGGTEAAITVTVDDSNARVTIRDDGIGVFERLRSDLELEDHLTALEELSKGKRTTVPDAHSGEGIFFTSKAVDQFTLEGNGIAYTTDTAREDVAVGRSDVTSGTRVSFTVTLRTNRNLTDVFDAYTDDDLRFSKTRLVVKLFERGTEFVSRSEGKRIMGGLEGFTEIVIDFAGVEHVGQGFADEVFRVWPSQHPGVTVTPDRMIREVEFMVRRALRNG